MLRMPLRKHIPRGCRSNFIPGLTDESKSLYEAYKKQYSIDSFGDTTIDTGNTLIDKMKDEKTDLTQNSRWTWRTIRKLSNDPTTPNHPCLVNANQVAHQLLINGQGTMPTKLRRPILPPIQEGTSTMVHPFSEEEYKKGIAALKNNKAAGRDDVLV